MSMTDSINLMDPIDELGIASEIRGLLRRCRIEGRVAKMPQSVPIGLHSRLQGALLKLGGHWSDSLGGYWFAGEAPYFDALISLTQEPEPMTTTTDTATPESPPGGAPDYSSNHNPEPPDYGRLELLLISDLIPNTMQPRREFDPVKLQELADSVRVHGVLQPVLVRPRAEGGYELIAGERRWRASEMAGRDRIPAYVQEGVTDEQSAVRALRENRDRAQLNPIDEATSFQNIITRFGWTQGRVASEVGTDQPTVAARLALLDMPVGVQKLFAKGDLTPTHGKVLMGVHDRVACEAIATKAAEGHWSVALLKDEVNEYQAQQRALAGQTSILDVEGVFTPSTSSIEVSSQVPTATEEVTDSHDDDGSDTSEQAAAEEDADEDQVPSDDDSSPEPEEDDASPECDDEPALGDGEIIAEAPLPPTSAAPASAENTPDAMPSPHAASAGTASPAASSPAASTRPTSSPSSAAGAPAKPIRETAEAFANADQLQKMSEASSCLKIAGATSAWPSVSIYAADDGRSWVITGAAWQGQKVLEVTAYPVVPETDSPIPAVTYRETPQFSYVGLGIACRGNRYIVQSPKTTFKPAPTVSDSPISNAASPVSQAGESDLIESLNRKIAELEAQLAEMRRSPIGITQALVAELEQDAHPPTQPELHPEAVKAMEQLLATFLISEIMTTEDMQILNELYTEQEDATTMIASTLLIKRCRQVRIVNRGLD